MCCPWFEPLEPSAATDDRRSSMLPLGNFWTGTCLAAPDRPVRPDHATLQHCCNLGYARESCPYFPQPPAPDAVRFTISRDHPGPLRVDWVIERGHLPFAHGSFDDPGAPGDFPAPFNESLSHQAAAYMASYRRRKAEAFAR